MTFQPDRRLFQPKMAIGTLVLVDMHRSYLTGSDGLRRCPVASIIANCRLALSAARRSAWHVAFVCGDGANTPRCQGWLRGFEPQRSDAIFDRRSPSCYSSPYFSGAVDSNGSAIVIAGFLGEGGCLSTAADAIMAGHGITFLTDAIKDHTSVGLFGGSAIQLLRNFTTLDIAALPSADWSRQVAVPPDQPGDGRCVI
jgi:nicotinamidase-related amidase